jgi:histone-lysine N-methyltransferase SETMAR
MLYEFRKGNNATTASKIFVTFMKKELYQRDTCQKWFSRFCEGDVHLNDQLHTEHPSKVDNDQKHALIENDQHLTFRDITIISNVSKTQVVNHLKAMGVVSKCNLWAPHFISKKKFNGPCHNKHFIAWVHGK